MSHAKERRQIARQIFKEEKRRLLQHPDWLTKKQKRALRSYTFKLDRGTTRRGACHYPGVKDGIVTEGAISLSTAMVENAPSEELRQVVRHELAHACCPGDNHNATWRAFCLKIGGDGKSHCHSKEIERAVGHKVTIKCETCGWTVHRQAAPRKNSFCRSCRGPETGRARLRLLPSVVRRPARTADRSLAKDKPRPSSRSQAERERARVVASSAIVSLVDGKRVQVRLRSALCDST